MDRNLETFDEVSGNEELTSFYDCIIQFLRTCPVHVLPPHIISNVAVMLHTTLLFDSEWEGYASKMGITDNLLLSKIKASSKVSMELPLYVTMSAALQRINGNLSHVITALIDSKRFDILRYLKPYITELLEKHSASQVKEFESAEEQLPCIKSENSSYLLDSTKGMNNEAVSLNSISNANSEKSCTIELNPASLEKQASWEFDTLQQKSVGKNFVPEVLIHPISKSSELFLEEGTLQKMKPFPSAPASEKLSVFIQHTEFDIEVARQLSAMFREGGITVTTQHDMENLIVMDSIGALSTIFKEVDFIVPIVSRKFWEQIHPQIFEKYLESTDAMNNRILYQLVMTEYRNNRCVNFRVRPVIVPDMNKRLLINDIILSYSFRLWSEVPKLIKILKETKDLIPKYPFN